MKKYICLFGVLGFLSFAQAQNVYSLQDPVTSRSFSTSKYSDIRGTPFLVDKWINGSVTTTKGTYASLELKYNVYDNTLVFNKDEESYEMIDDILSFTLKPKANEPSGFLVFKKGISGADIRPGQFVQVLAEGNINLYKLPVKQVSEMSEVNAGVVQTFTNNAKYYIGKTGQLHFIKMNKEEVLNAMQDKQSQIESFIREKKLSLRKEGDVIDLITYYNSL
ncbi:MAG: hypothetical protein KGO92_01975 [Bacteroidota bacterium]|nr:hypothetical protein [Bacteroidota bacterium]